MLAMGLITHMSYSSVFTYTFTVSQSAINMYGHVNNFIYVQWIQDASARQPGVIPGLIQPKNSGWIPYRHQIEYIYYACSGGEFEVRTWVAEIRQMGVVRKYEIVQKVDDMVVASGQTEWIFADLITGKPIPIFP